MKKVASTSAALLAYFAIYIPWVNSEELPPPEPVAELEESQQRHEVIDISEPEPDDYEIPNIYALLSAPKIDYRISEGTTTLIPANAAEFGRFSMESTQYLEAGENFGLSAGVGFHFLSGPTSTPIPSRVFDFKTALQSRKHVGPKFSYDVAASIGVFSDFEDSARDGVRFPSHAVGFFHPNPCLDIVFGVEYLHRDDIKVLPVVGLVLREANVRAELVFPRPRIDFALNDDTSLFVKGELGGGSWDIERPDETNDVFTYRDYRVSIGLQTLKSGKTSSIEFGYVFDRQLSFRSSLHEEEFDDTFMIQLLHQY